MKIRFLRDSQYREKKDYGQIDGNTVLIRAGSPNPCCCLARVFLSVNDSVILVNFVVIL